MLHLKVENNYINSVKRQFEYYQNLGEKTFDQLNDSNIQWQINDESNSIAIIVNHMVGNMLSRWTNFTNEDGEKKWRNRDSEFENPFTSKNEMLIAWSRGWNCLFEAINSLKEKDLTKIIYIRNEGHTVVEAINRQLCHYSYHVGQLVYLAKMIKNDDWKTLSIARNKSSHYNRDKFNIEKSRKHFTDDV